MQGLVCASVSSEFDSRRLHLLEKLVIFHILEYEIEVLLKPLDVVVSVKAAVMDEPRWTIAQMAEHLGIADSQVFRAARSAATAGLLVPDAGASRGGYAPNRSALLELLIHGLKYMAVPGRGRITRGVPTAHAAPILVGRMAAGDEPPPVWPHATGKVRGESFEPLHRCVPGAALRDDRFYAAMALVDAIRGGRARDRAIATKLIDEVLSGKRK